MEQFDTMTAVFKPARTDDLKPEARAFVGQRIKWCAGWLIEDGAYAGQFAMIPHGPNSFTGWVPGWVPECDLAEIAGAIVPFGLV